MERFSLKYVDSHIYDIYAILVGTVTLAIVMVLKIPIKLYSRKAADRYCRHRGLEGTEHEKEWERIYKRWNGLIYILVIIVAFMVFGVTAQISPQIEFRIGSATMSVVYTIAEYEIIDWIL